eukprot:TRINITY_DN123709_c0_g1_i1.p1 TRINITY_DN123709_c0_g1~~TRINITY_DN123709_c0_g1_i1.p1  ORF type:complete len:488 (+),score=76.54 TRINITY_DN123709_c0_g1_i1:63-1526(+)
MLLRPQLGRQAAGYWTRGRLQIILTVLIIFAAGLQIGSAYRIDDEDDFSESDALETYKFANALGVSKSSLVASAAAGVAASQSAVASRAAAATARAAESASAEEAVPSGALLAALLLLFMSGFCAWRLYKVHESEFENDSSQEVPLWPSTLFVHNAFGYEGTYRIVDGEQTNGLPLWKKENGNDWIFCGLGGQWFVGDEDEYRVGFQCNTGNIASFEENAGRMPDEIGPGGWLFFNGSEWVDAPDINITSELFGIADQQATALSRQQHEVAATKIQARFRGNQDRRHVKHVRQVRAAQAGQEGDGAYMWPRVLYVARAKGYSGAYNIVSGVTPNGLPLRKRQDAKLWIFCGEGGQWLIGDEDEEAMNFQCDTGNVASSEQNAGRLPDEIGRGGWLYFNGQQWAADPEINITSDLFTEKDQEAAAKMFERRSEAATKIQAKIRGSQTRVQIASETVKEDGTVTKPVPQAVKKAGMLTRARSIFGGGKK